MLPAASTSRPTGKSNPVFDPKIEKLGASLPLSVGAYAVIALEYSSATTMSPAASRARDCGPFSRVSGPLIVAEGLVSVGANRPRLFAGELATHRFPAPSTTRPLRPVRPVMVRIGT